MIEQQQKLVLSPYMEIYELVIPKDNLLRQIKELVDFGFIYDELLDKYCLDNGRNAVSPIRMFKYLLLKAIYDLSDVDVVERSKYDMSFKYFLEMVPEEDVINPSSLTKFRKLRLKDMKLFDILIAKTVQIALDKGIIKSKSIIVDATHTKSRYNQKTPCQALREQSKKLRRTIYEVDETMKEKFPAKNTEDSIITQGNRTKTDEFEFNKDAGMYQCKAGHLAIHKYLDKRKRAQKNKNPRMVYFFDIEKCKDYPYRDGCYIDGAKKKTYTETIICDSYSEQAQFQETEHYKEKMKERYKIEAKNSERKNRHGYDVASPSGLVGMEMQGAMTIFAINLKRIFFPLVMIHRTALIVTIKWRSLISITTTSAFPSKKCTRK